MKHLFACAMLLAFVTLGNISKAQTSTRPSLFDAFPNSIGCSGNELERIFTSSTNSTLLLSFSNSNFSGQISSAIQRYSNLKSVVVKLNNLQGAVFTISKRINDDNTFVYTGHIINEQFADGYELKKDVNGNYSLNKIKLDDILQDR